MPRTPPRLWPLLTLTLGAAAALGASCKGRQPHGAPQTQPAPSPRGASLRLYYLVDLDGYLEPCGCQSRPLGGIDRLAQLVRAEQAEAPRSLIVSVGSLFFAEARLDETMAWQERQKAHALTGILNGLGLAAWTPGPADFALGAQEFGALRGELRAPALSANGGGAGATVREVGGVRVGIVGVSDFRPANGEAGAEAPSTSDPVAAARREVAAARAQGAQVVVVLASLPRRQARMIAGDIPGVDFVIAARNESATTPLPERIGSAFLVTAANQGKGVGVIDLFVRGDGAFVDASESSRRAERDRLDARARDLRARIEAWARDPSTDANALATQRARLAEIERQRASLDAQRAPAQGRWFDYRAVEIAPDVPRLPEVSTQIATYFRAVNEHNRVEFASRAPPPAPPGTARYLGAEACRDCHEEAYQVWQRTRHSHAYRTIEVVSKNFNLSCVGCHVTGYRRPGGSEVVQNEGLRDVQCESCHGPGSLHVAARGEQARRAAIHRTFDGRFCASECHTPEHSDRFDYDRYLPHILGPGHGRPADAGMPDPDASPLAEADATAH